MTASDVACDRCLFWSFIGRAGKKRVAGRDLAFLAKGAMIISCVLVGVERELLAIVAMGPNEAERGNKSATITPAEEEGGSASLIGTKKPLEHCRRSVRLALSRSIFCSAIKASCGKTPPQMLQGV